ncbi:thymidylate synthase [Synchytrium microbalum]|uniref:thymidylate synthase n=1 Tax=Synchytrium microbalum TaxID=1806994 RepID=A0A507CC68_9FUNG|nr:thymidylate synthase [Synchytrium microbalum]TPX37212.1 thymidylate synthase [Synchytrium microbalum]
MSKTTFRYYSLAQYLLIVFAVANKHPTQLLLYGMLAALPDQTVLSPAKASNANTAPGTNDEEAQYLSLLNRILQEGETRQDRTGTGTKSLFAPPQCRFNLKDNIFPLLTTKRVAFRAIFEELMWFIRGCTDGKLLAAKGVKIWEGNGSRAYLDSIGLSHRREGDLGPVYGFQWRHFGAQYVDADADYTGKGVDQLKQVLHKIVHKPQDRRIVLSAWNPADLAVMALPPCHMFVQFYVSLPTSPGTKPVLSCQLYQRSCDMGLGIPFNIASYSLFLILVAHVTGCTPGEFVHCMGDTHIYLDHVDALKEQITRTPRAFPTIKIKRARPEGVLSDEEMVRALEAFQFEDIEIIGYNPHPTIKMAMSV